MLSAVARRECILDLAVRPSREFLHRSLSGLAGGPRSSARGRDASLRFLCGTLGSRRHASLPPSRLCARWRENPNGTRTTRVAIYIDRHVMHLEVARRKHSTHDLLEDILLNGLEAVLFA
jgi:hypothetical protein